MFTSTFRVRAGRRALVPVLLLVTVFLSLGDSDHGHAQEVLFDNIAQNGPLGEPTIETTTITQSTVGATLEAGESAPCGDIGATVWYSFSVPRDTGIVVDTTGSDFATIVAAYTLTDFVPSPPGGSLANVACGASDGERARITFNALAGERYYLQFGGAAGATGTLSLRVACEPACRPPNDDVLIALSVSPLPSAAVQADTQRATLEPGEQQPCGNIGATAWYRLALPGFLVESAAIRIDTLGSDFDTVVALYEQPDFGASPPGGIVPVACNDDGSGQEPTSLLEAPLRAGVQYYIQAGGKDGAGGELHIQVFCDGCPIASEGPGGPGTGGEGVIVQPDLPISGPETGSGGYR
jgi:hypothetical protein